MQSGIIEEMLDDTMESLDDDELEEEADAEVDKVLFDLTDGKLGQAGAVGADLPVSLSVLSPRTNFSSDTIRSCLCRPRRKQKRISTTKPRCNVCRKSCTISSPDDRYQGITEDCQ